MGCTLSLRWPGITSGFPKELGNVAREKEVYASFLRLLPNPDKQQRMDRWMADVEKPKKKKNLT